MVALSEAPAPSYPQGAGDQTGRAARLAHLAKALAHPSRIQIVETLLRRQTCIGCDIVEEIGLAASTTSEHLRILKEAGIIAGEIMRPRVCYSLEPGAVRPLIAFLELIDAKQSLLPPN
ncbi:MAG: metalloregulator ArsR/SmtB family transcription factor [Proteobacteria bacterium]|nr:metalloregulator ArsR/SmtB family transcription factor [Pseudomonadota bacterium]